MSSAVKSAIIRLIYVSHVFLVAISCLSCESSYCDGLESRARNVEVQTELRRWVNQNLVGKTIPSNQVISGDGFGPGIRWLDKEFDGNLLGFGKYAHVRLVGPRARDELNDTITENVGSILFTERSRTGILVRTPNSSEFKLDPGFDSNRLIPVADDIAVLCDFSD
jgi:hypothetical protein